MVEARTRQRVKFKGNATTIERRVTKPEEGPLRVIERRRHASTTFVAVEGKAPVPIDHWTPPLVAVRLKRMARIFHGLPMSADIRPAGHRSSMPEPILDRSKDYAPDKTTPRLSRSRAEIDLATTTFQVVLRLVAGHEVLSAIIWTIALGNSFEECEAELKGRGIRRGVGARNLRNIWAERVGPAIAELFNSIPVVIERDDVIELPDQAIHKKL